jgi:hypothetical protein
MKTRLGALAFIAAQAMSMQDEPVVHLKPHSAFIEIAFGGSLVELSHAPTIVHLPPSPPRPDAAGNQWAVDVKNFGPTPVTIADTGTFSAPVAVNETIHIYSNGHYYILKH